MSKNAITLSDLQDAVKPLSTSIDRLTAEMSTTTVQVSELYQMISNLSTKTDLMLLKDKNSESNVVKTPVKKSSEKKSTQKRGSKETKEE